MSAITPQTNLKLLICPIESDNRNQMTFATKTAQYNYFNSLQKLEVENFTYQRKDSVIRYPAHIDSILEYNYVMYQNENYTDKWFYAFITNMEYINDNMTLITIKTDVYQTWQFNISWEESFIEREHVNDDSIGANLVPENLETGDYEIYQTDEDQHLNDSTDLSYYLATTLDLNQGGQNPIPQSGGGIYNGIYGGSTYYKYERNQINDIKDDLNNIANKGQLEQIVGLFMAPSFLGTVTTGKKVNDSATPVSYELVINKTYNDYTNIKNNKLYTYPYCYMAVTNGAGNSNIYKYEYFNGSTCNFSVDGVLAPGASIRLTPYYYNGSDYKNQQESLTLGKFPICNYNVDMYTNWLTQNSINVAGKTITTDTMNLFSTGLSSILGAFTNPLSLSTAPTQIGNAMVAKKQHELLGEAVKGDINNGDVITASNNNTFKFYHMTVKEQFARKIDDYFSMYGYQVNEVKLPNITGRLNWNYVKTIGANIEGVIPENDLNEIKSLFNNGITLWHNPNTYLQYSENNPIV